MAQSVFDDIKDDLGIAVFRVYFVDIDHMEEVGAYSPEAAARIAVERYESLNTEYSDDERLVVIGNRAFFCARRSFENLPGKGGALEWSNR